MLNCISTHVLDTTIGQPAVGMVVNVLRLEGTTWSLLNSVVTNNDGRSDDPLLRGIKVTAAVYRLEFYVGNYFRRAEAGTPGLPFFDVVPVQFGIADTSLHYHVALLCTPWSYSTYRGS